MGTPIGSGMAICENTAISATNNAICVIRLVLSNPVSFKHIDSIYSFIPPFYKVYQVKMLVINHSYLLVQL